MDNDRKIIGWCYYCKDAIYDGDPFVLLEGEKYHNDCYSQMQKYPDNFLENDE